MGELPPPDELQQDVQHVYKSGEHLMIMINDLLDLSRAEIGALSLYFELIQPAALLKDVFHDFARTENVSPDLRWVLAVPGRLPVIRADMVRLRQILTNLLSNASKYTRSGTITLGAEVELPYLHVWVQDTGQGVPVELQSKIFEPFGTVGRKRRPEGIGLGLSITRHLVGLHDGLITLESQPGAGSTFHIYLPLPGVSSISVRSRPPDTSAQRTGTQGAPTYVAPTPEAELMLLVISNQPNIPSHVQEMCASHKLVPVQVRGHEDLSRALAEGVPAAVAWDMSQVSPSEWNLIYRLSASQDCTALPVVLFDGADEVGQASTGLTHVVFKSCNGNTLKDWIGLIEDPTARQGTILIVDDDPQARDYYLKMLERSHPGRRVVVAENGSRALDILQNEVPALILLDLMMPEVDGFKVLERVRSDVRTQHIPVVIISGKLLNYEDVQHLNNFKTVFHTKGVFSDHETVEFLSQIEGDAKSLPQPTSMLIKQVLAFLHQNYPLPINRKDIANAVGVSENYLSQIFRQEITISPWDYLNRLRIQRSKELLLNTQGTVTSIASQVGFNDSAYFSRVFHKLTGLSPQEFRQSKQ
jgi:AraC-like DNA-binding protein